MSFNDDNIVEKYYRYSEISGYDDFFCIVVRKNKKGHLYYTELNESIFQNYKKERRIRKGSAEIAIKQSFWRKKN